MASSEAGAGGDSAIPRDGNTRPARSDGATARGDEAPGAGGDREIPRDGNTRPARSDGATARGDGTPGAGGEGATTRYGNTPGRDGDGDAAPRPADRRQNSAATDGSALGARLRAGDRTAAPAALNLLETRTAREEAAALVAAAGDGDGHIVGVTGPPGVGKSTLLSALLREWRGQSRSVAVLAVDPSSKRSGGALLGDRARIEHEPADRDVFIRSMAAGERLGGLAPATRAAAQALANAFDVVVIETVGVGQSETDVAEAADTVAVIVQPGSGDALQFLKAGIMEVPDVLVVTKADLGASARRAEQDLRAALGALGARHVPVLAVSSVRPTAGIEGLAAALQAHRDQLDRSFTRTRARRLGALADFLHEHGERGLRALGGRRAARRWLEQQEPGLAEPELLRRLEERATG